MHLYSWIMIHFVKQVGLLGILCFLCACQSGRQQEAGSIVPTDGLKTISVQVEEGMFEHLGDYLYADSYVCLDTVPLLGDIEKVEIKDDRIYVLDAFNKIVCYDMQARRFSCSMRKAVDRANMLRLQILQ